MSETMDRMLERRRAHVSSTLSILYPDNPIHVVSARGQYIYDTEGREYLDCMNNVPHIGHSHPRVTEAITRQISQVNTNTRFMYEPLVAYAERISDKFPAGLDVCYFVNSGSEANELALRLAQAHTGHDGAVVLSAAYHGNTTSLIDRSPYKFNGRGGGGRPSHVQVAPAPDAYRGPHRATDAAQRYVDEVDDAFIRAAHAGRPASVFMAEALMGTAGQIEAPTGYLAPAFDTARAHGALALADEVQIGFGRMGTHFWGFETQAAVPDIVTLGKPIGNGFPLGAVVTTREVAASFANGVEYFNTFGGAPVSCAVGLAVLDVIEEEQLQQHAEKVGATLLEELREVGRKHRAIGDVRGRGLFIGIEMVTDREERTPGPDIARAVMHALRQAGILISTDGPNDNVLKIKPPLPFSQDDADRLVETIDRSLSQLAGFVAS